MPTLTIGLYKDTNNNSPFPAFKMHLWRQSIVKPVDSDLRIYYYFLHRSGRAQYTVFNIKLHD